MSVESEAILINRNLLRLWAGAQRTYLISLQPEALARSWLLGYLFENRHSDLGSVLGVCMCVCSSFSGKLPSPLLACMYLVLCYFARCLPQMDWSVCGLMNNNLGEQLILQWRVCLLIRCSDPWRNSNNHRHGWRHVPESHCHWPPADSNDLRSHSRVTTQQSNTVTCLQLAETCCRHRFTSKWAAAHSASSSLSLETKQQHVESDYTRGTLLCPPKSDDGDGWAWIFTARMLIF